MEIEVWADVVCPFCYLARQELNRALEAFEHGDKVTLIWHSFELDQLAAATPMPIDDYMALAYQMSPEDIAAHHRELDERAAQIGVRFDWEQMQACSTLDAHRLIKLAALENRGSEVIDRLMEEYFTAGAVPSDRDYLIRVGIEAGLDAENVHQVINGTEFADAVHTDEQLGIGFGIPGVPFMIIADEWAVDGAREAQELLDILEQTWDLSHGPKIIPLGTPSMPAPAGGCGCGGCGCGSK